MLLTVTGAAQRWLPMPRWSRVLGVAGPVPSTWRGQEVAALPVAFGSVVEFRVGSAIARGGQLLPWTPTCLAEAATGQVMLARRGEPGVVVVGLRRGNEADGAAWDAHAWLVGARGAVTGGPAAEGFTATTVFERPGGRTADVVASAHD